MSMEYKHILITGGAGFVGSSLALALKEAYSGTRVSIIDNLSRKGSELNVARLRAPGIEFFQADVAKRESFSSFTDVDLILDCAANPSVLAGHDGAARPVVESNLWGTLEVLELTRVTGAALIFLSTSRIYPVKELNDIATSEEKMRFVLAPSQTLEGVNERGISEAFPLGEGRTLYGATKLASEMLIHEYISLYGLRAVISRYGVIAGPWQFGKTDQGLAALWMARHVFPRPLSYIGFGGTGKQVRDFLHVDDLVDAVRYQIEHLDLLAGQTFNLGGGVANSASLLELTELCQNISGKKLVIGSMPETRWGDVRWYVSDYSRFQALTGWQPKRALETIMHDVHTWMQENRERLTPLFG